MHQPQAGKSLMLNWALRAGRLWNTMGAGFCLNCPEQSLQLHGKSDLQYRSRSRNTYEAFTEELKAKILQIGIDERGRAADNISVELLVQREMRRYLSQEIRLIAGDNDRADGIVCFL